MKDNDFFEVRDKLTAFFTTHPGAILDAETYPDTASSRPRKAGRVFELASGIQKRRFLSLWALFQSREMFALTTQHIGKIARRIREKTRFQTIVTCTVTSRYLMEHLHSDLEVNENDKVDVRYFGAYPYHIVKHGDLQDLKDKRVLILTDVISSGSVAGHLASVVQQLGGEVAAILSVAIVNPDYCLIAPKYATAGNSTYAPQYRLLNFGSLAEKFPVYNIIDVPIPPSPASPSLNDVIKIDPLSVLPVANLHRDVRGRGSILSMADAIPLLEQTDAISVNFFQAENCRYTYAIRIPKILKDETVADAVWKRLKHIVPPGRNTLFVTTFDKECLIFSDFVTSRCGFSSDDPDHVMQVPFAGEMGGAAAHTFIQNEAERIKGRTVVLLLGVVHTSERLRSLVALLASARPKRIISIILLDRMDASSSMFVPRVRELSADINGAKTVFLGIARNASVRFSSHSVFCLRDFSTNEIGRMQEMVRRLLKGFEAWCRTSSFKLLTEHDEKYFNTHRISGYEFEIAKLPPFKDVQRLILGGETVETHTSEAHLFSLITKAVEERNYSAFFDLLMGVRDKSILYRIACYLLIDISFLRGTGDFNQLTLRAMERLNDSRVQRCTLEMETKAHATSSEDHAAQLQALKDTIRTEVLVESYLIFVLALISFLDTKSDYRKFIEELMFYGNTHAEEILNSSPLNAIIYLGQARILWAITFLAFLTDRNFREPDSPALRRTMVDQASRLSQWLSKKLALPDFAAHEQEIRAAISNLDGLRSELGEYNLHQYHEMIRLMHKQLILQPPQHSPTRTILVGILHEMMGQLDLRPVPEAGITFAGLPNQREIQMRLEEGWQQISVLQRIGEAASELFSNTVLATLSMAPERFLPGQGVGMERGRKPSAFEDDVKHMAAILLKVRSTNIFNRADADDFSKRLDKIDRDLWHYYGSPLLRSLCHFIQPLDARIHSALASARQNLSSYERPDLVEALKNAEFVGFKPNELHFVLCDPTLLTETLRNIFTNMRHAAQEEIARPVITCLPKSESPRHGASADGDDGDVIRVEIWTPGDASKIPIDKDNPSTLVRHTEALRTDYAAELSVRPGENGAGVVTSLSFRSRNLHAARLRREWQNRDDESKRRFAAHIFFGDDT